MSNFVWYDAMTDNLKAAESFYRNVIGWDAKDSGMTDRSYTIFSIGERSVGGVMPIPKEACEAGMRPCWRGYIGVDNVDDYASRVQAAGGALHRGPEDIPGVGRFAVVADPHGAEFILFTGQDPTQAPQPAQPGTPGFVGWHELHAGDLESAFTFYSGLFGWTKGEAHDMGPVGMYQLFAVDGVPVGGMMTKTSETPAPSWLYYFNVEGIDAAMERVKKNGGKIANGPCEVPGGSWISQCIDPQGAMFALVACKR